MLSKATGDKSPAGTNSGGNSCAKTCKDLHDNRQRMRQHMLECEAREWLRRGFNNRHDIRVLQNAISKRRGYEATERLIEEMRKQWKNRAEWLK